MKQIAALLVASVISAAIVTHDWKLGLVGAALAFMGGWVEKIEK